MRRRVADWLPAVIVTALLSWACWKFMAGWCAAQLPARCEF